MSALAVQRFPHSISGADLKEGEEREQGAGRVSMGTEVPCQQREGAGPQPAAAWRRPKQKQGLQQPGRVQPRGPQEGSACQQT